MAAGELDCEFANLAVKPLAARANVRFVLMRNKPFVLKQIDRVADEPLTPHDHIARPNSVLLGNVANRSHASDGVDRDLCLDLSAILLSCWFQLAPYSLYLAVPTCGLNAFGIKTRALAWLSARMGEIAEILQTLNCWRPQARRHRS